MDIVKLQLSGLNFFRTVINSDFDKQNVFFYICDDKLNLMYSLNEDYEYIKPLSFKFNFGKILYFSRKNKNDQFERFFPIFYADKKKVACFFVLVGSFDFVDLCTPKVNLFLKNITYTETTKNEFHKITENEDGTLNLVNIKKDKVTNTKTEEKKTTRVHPHHNFKTVYDKLNEEIDNYLLIIRRKDNKQLTAKCLWSQCIRSCFSLSCFCVKSCTLTFCPLITVKASYMYLPCISCVFRSLCGNIGRLICSWD